MTKINWHPFPKEKPETYRYCFVTIETRDRKSKKKNRFVEIDFLVYFFGFHWARHKYWKIIAWAYVPDSYSSIELPEPYRPEAKDDKLMDLVDFDINDEKTYPKREGTYLVVSEFGKLNMAFWCEVEKVRNSSEFWIRKNPRWLCDIDCPNIKKYCPTPLSELDWTTGAKKNGHTA